MGIYRERPLYGPTPGYALAQWEYDTEEPPESRGETDEFPTAITRFRFHPKPIYRMEDKD